MNIREIPNDIKSDRPKKIILDTDTFNEEDDQFALAYACLSDRLDLAAICAAPFDNEKSGDFARGMELSFGEIGKVLSMIDSESTVPVYRGSTSRARRGCPVATPASDAVVRTVRESSEPVYVLAIGAGTNVANALMTDPSIKDNLTVIWLAGNELGCPDPWEFNLMQDIAAGQIILDSGVPLLLCPAWGVVSALTASDGDIGELRGQNPLCDYLASIVEARFDKPGWKKIIWDIAAPAIPDIPQCADIGIIPAPIVNDDGSYSVDPARHEIMYLRSLDRDAVIGRTWELLKSLR